MGNVLSEEFRHSWQILRQAIENISIDDWNKNMTDWSFSSTVYHIIETADFYIGNTPEGMEWGKRAGFSWEEDDEETISTRLSSLTKAYLIDYLNEIENEISHFLEESTEQDLFSTDEFDDGNLLIIKKMLYLLRHNMHHIGELNKTLRDCGSRRINWE
ncbi:MAG: DinB family protein [Candidatus Hodarchaeales archaeon]